MRALLRWTVGLVLIAHGLIHLMGAVEGFGWADVPQLSEPVGTAGAVGWLIAAVLVVAVGALLIAGARWWALAAVAAVASQVMIATSWNDAWAGTPANAVLALTAVYGFRSHGPASTRAEFERLSRQTIESAYPVDVGGSAPVSQSDLAHLPEPVAEFVRAAGAVGRPHVTGFRATISGRIRSEPAAPWMPWVGEQVNTYGSTPSRVLFMDATMKGLPTDVLHAYLGPHATMRVRLASLLTVVDARGTDMDQAETVTLLNDMCVLAPAALVDAPIEWSLVDAHRARATYQNAGHTATAVLTFDDQHRLVDFVSDDRLRSSSDGRTFTPQRWSTPIGSYREYDGRLVGAVGYARWHPDNEPPFEYLEFRTDDLHVIEAPARRPSADPPHRARRLVMHRRGERP